MESIYKASGGTGPGKAASYEKVVRLNVLPVVGEDVAQRSKFLSGFEP
jgi:hypothetical protein